MVVSRGGSINDLVLCNESNTSLYQGDFASGLVLKND